MSENDSNLSPALLPPPAPDTGRTARKATIAFLIIFIILAGGVSLLRHRSLSSSFMQPPQSVAAPVAPVAVTPSDTRFAALEDKIRNMQNQIDALNAKPQQSDDAADAAANKQSAADIARLQSDVTSLSAAVSGLQSEIKRAGSSAEQSQKTTQAALATAIAFIQLRETALAGQSFTNELAAMRNAARNDGVFQEQLAKLEPFAAKGVPSMAALQSDLIAHESAAANAADRAGAKTIWDKIVAELKTLISVRPLHGDAGGADGFAPMENALAHGDIAAALDDLKAMPAPAQSELNGWRGNAEARLQTDEALRLMAAHFSAPPATQDAP